VTVWLRSRSITSWAARGSIMDIPLAVARIAPMSSAEPEVFIT